MGTPDRKGSTRRSRTWAAIVLRNATQCALCNKPIDRTLKFPDPMSATADHIIPWTEEPQLRYDPRNGQPAHLSCNSKKGNGRNQNRKPPTSRDW